MYIFTILLYLVGAVFVSFVIFILLYYHWRWPSYKKLCRQIPGPKCSAIIGVGLELISLKHTEVFNYIANLLEQYGPIVHIEYLGGSNVFINEPNDIELILSNSQHITKGVEYTPILPWLCEGLLTSTGEKWHLRRKMLTSTFHFKILENFIPVFNRNAKLLTEKIVPTEGSAIDIDTYVSYCTLDVICETAMGLRIGFQKGEALEYFSAIKTACVITVKKILTFWMTNEFIFKISPVGREFRRSVNLLHRFTEKVIEERKMNYQPYHQKTEYEMQKRRISFLDCLIEMQRENPKEMTDRGIREEVDTFMFEGHDTTSSAITWTLFMIACHENVQTKLQEEMQQVFGDSDRDATFQDVHQLTYLDIVIKETLRLYPSVPYLSRTITTHVKIRDYTIPPNTNLTISPYLVHRNPNMFPDPEKFIPERFLPHVAKDRHPFAYIPFSAGFRNCIGQKFANLELKVVISTILRKFKLSTEMKMEEVKVLPHLILRPDPKILMTFTLR